MTLPLDTIAAVAGIVAGVTGLSWLAYEFAPAIIEGLGPQSSRDRRDDWSRTPWGDVPAVHQDLFHSETINRKGR